MFNLIAFAKVTSFNLNLVVTDPVLYEVLISLIGLNRL